MWRPGAKTGRLIRAARRVYWELWQRQLPHGMVSVRYLLPGQDPRVRFHARLWWQSGSGFPRVVWLLVEFWLWFRWVTFTGWRACWRAMRRWGAQVETQHGVPRWQQARRLIGLSIGGCVPPRDVYLFGLFREPDRVWDFVYDHEIQAYHRWRNGRRGSSDKSRSLLADKLRQAEVLSERGVPTAPILVCVPRRERGKERGKGVGSQLCEAPKGPFRQLTPDPFSAHDPFSAQTRLFCKTRSGNRGIGAFSAWRTEAGIQGRLFSGEPLPDAQAVTRAWHDLLEIDDALIQPALVNHPRLAPLAVGDDAITVRYITCSDQANRDCLSATLEVPAGWDDRGRPLYVILPIEPETGVIRPFPDEFIHDKDAQERHAAVLSQLPPDCAVPDWQIVVEASRRAHEAVPDLWAVAWDWVLTPDGPCLLEGNSGWGAATPQLLQGGFLRPLSTDSTPRK